jgi:uncharacterized protein (TIGR04222 family)
VGNTWGISGPLFLLVYVALVGLAWLAAERQWRSLESLGPSDPAGPTDLDPYEIAVLNGGEKLAVTVAVARLCRARIVGPDVKTRTLRALAPLPVKVHPVEQAVYARVSGSAGPSFWVIRDYVSVSPELMGLRDGLVRRGLLLDAEQARRARRHALWLVPVLALGLVRLAAGLTNGKPVTFLLTLLLATAALLLVLANRPARLTRQGHTALRQVRKEHPELYPRPELPASAGPLAAAVFGTGALWLADGDLAAQLQLPRGGFWGGGGSGGSYGGGGCGGGGCGGGGCGGGCGG